MSAAEGVLARGWSRRKAKPSTSVIYKVWSKRWGSEADMVETVVLTLSEYERLKRCEAEHFKITHPQPFDSTGISTAKRPDLQLDVVAGEGCKATMPTVKP